VDVTIPLDRPRTLRYTTRAMRLVEQRSGHPLGELLITCVGPASAAWLLWGALIHADEAFQRRQEPDLTIDDVCDLLDTDWFEKGNALKDLWPFFREATVAAGYFSTGATGKDSPETGPGSPGSGDSDSSTSASVPGSNG